ncbi:DICT sensory domain-containing protein [Gloeobacter kilaueensis]|uniref:Metal dependent phosphohydrolase n=1 Tax=Gloeobacter kilaueensis (strain ATCC BAA-2537 / CCAP 1431/1 / ULC 316 / JS1) TaxID=1183438 RepID=U5QFT7_GLOK1|nr:DICT sensory domain-containing protein [Gloeobacter kilaueensis]AGY56479.1 metal dependent phosphohydrolase [Gloeobacter kilaueensis JS1]
MLKGSILYQLREQLGADPPSFGVYYKNTLVALCHALEDHILSCGSPPLVLTAFQRGKWYAQEAKRYRQIAQHSREILIMAVPDAGFLQPDNPANLLQLSLDEADPVAAEWHLLILAPNYAAMVMCQELSDRDYGEGNLPQQDLERKFYGFWTFEEPLVLQAVRIVLEHVRSYDPDLSERLKAQAEAIVREPAATRTDLSGVVARVVTYLQTSQQQLINLSKPAAPVWEAGSDRLGGNLTANRLQAFLRMAQRIDAGDPSNPDASLQVSNLVETLGQLMHLPFGRLRRLRLAALLHRIGLSEIPATLIDPDSPATYQAFAQAAQFGCELLRSMNELRTVARIVEHQCEWWDGSGAPEHLAGEEIPLESRILGLVSYFQEWLVPRGERPACTPAEALALCEAGAGSRWDPQLLEHLANLVRLMQAGILIEPGRPQVSTSQWLLLATDAPSTSAS